MYGHPRYDSVNKVQSSMLKKMVGESDNLSKNSQIDLSKIPPCQDSLIPHVQRVNHRLAGYKRALEPIWEHPMPHDVNQGWEICDDGILQPIWSLGPILPQSLIDLLRDRDHEDEEDIDETDDVICEFDIIDDDD